MGAPENLERPDLTSSRLLFPKFVTGVCSDRYTKNMRTKLEVRSFTRSWDNRGYSKNFGSPWIRSHSLSSQIFKGLLFRWTLPNLKFVALRVPEIIAHSLKIWAVSGYAHASFFSKIVKGLLVRWTLWTYLPNLKFVALPVPEIIGGTPKIWAVCGYAHAHFSPKFCTGLCSDGPCEYTYQICSL